MTSMVIYRAEDGKLAGMRFGDLVAIRMSKHEGGRDWWLCQCDCGKQKEIFGKSLRRGLSKSCGCRIIKSVVQRSKTHGLSKHPLHGVLKNIRDRCTNPKNKDYHSYGGRGIKCLFSGLQEFVEWAIPAGWMPGLTIDRIDNNGNYSTTNCRIATHHTQSRNTRRNRFVFVNGRQLCFKDASVELGISYSLACERLKNGISSEQALGMEA